MTTINNKESKNLVSEIFATLANYGEVKVTGLGVFVVIKTKERQGINPKTGERITIPSRNRVKFRPAKQVKDFAASYNEGNGSRNETETGASDSVGDTGGAA